MPEYNLRIDYSIPFRSDKTLEELGKMTKWDLLKEAWESESMDFFGNGVTLWERIFEPIPEEERRYQGQYMFREKAKHLPHDHNYTGVYGL